MKKINKKNFLIILTVLFLFLSSTVAIGLPINKSQLSIPVTSSSMGSEYKGHLRIYIVEIESRWKMENGAPYEYAFFDFAFDETIEIPYLETYEDIITWQGDIEEDNVLIVAAIFNPEAHRKFADPPLGRPFDAFYVDAAAGVRPGETESSVKNDEFTHTVLCEVGSATTCPSCPVMASTLEQIYENGEYPFYFIEMVTDKNGFANGRMRDYNLKYLPSGFYDGGYGLVIGGAADATEHKEVIEAAGARDVHDLNFSLSSRWVSEGTIDITVDITNNEELPNRPPEKPTISGPDKTKPNVEKNFQLSTTDPDEDEVYFKIDWGDGDETEWIGPYPSGETTTVTHNWTDTGNYIMKAKAKDTDGEETEWTWLRVTVPKNKHGNIWLIDFLSNHLWFYSQLNWFN